MRVALTCLLTTMMFAAPAFAQTPAQPGPLAQVYACAETQDDAARLACYDAAVGRLQQAQSSGELVAVDRGTVETIEREGFGLSLPSLPRLFGGGSDRASASTPARPELTEMNLTVERLSQRGDGKAVFVMSNGQVWVQVDTTSTRRVRAGGAVTIRRASLGSFLMVVEAGGPAIRVRREQ